MSTGRFCWFDLTSTDLAVSKAFFVDLFGWEVRPHGPQYAMIHDREGRTLGGMLAAQPGHPSAWMPYVTTDDAVATAARLRELGGTVFMEHAAPGVGRFVIFADRQGAALATIQLEREDAPYPREKGEPHFAWSELHTNDPADAVAFYTSLFGWPTEAWGPAYTLVGEEHAAGIVQGRAGAPPHWLVYVNTRDTDATAARVVALGGRVIVAPQDLPGVGRFAVLADPTGAVFAVMRPADGG